MTCSVDSVGSTRGSLVYRSIPYYTPSSTLGWKNAGNFVLPTGLKQLKAVLGPDRAKQVVVNFRLDCSVLALAQRFNPSSPTVEYLPKVSAQNVYPSVLCCVSIRMVFFSLYEKRRTKMRVIIAAIISVVCWLYALGPGSLAFVRCRESKPNLSFFPTLYLFGLMRGLWRRPIGFNYDECPIQHCYDLLDVFMWTYCIRTAARTLPDFHLYYFIPSVSPLLPPFLAAWPAVSSSGYIFSAAEKKRLRPAEPRWQ